MGRTAEAAPRPFNSRCEDFTRNLLCHNRDKNLCVNHHSRVAGVSILLRGHNIIESRELHFDNALSLSQTGDQARAAN